MLYGAARAIAFDFFLGDYGVRGEIYFLVEVLTAVPFAHFSAGLISAMTRGEPKTKYAVGTAISYIAPDLYLVFEAREAPAHIYAVTLGIIALLTSVSIVSLLRKVRLSNLQ